MFITTFDDLLLQEHSVNINSVSQCVCVCVCLTEESEQLEPADLLLAAVALLAAVSCQVSEVVQLEQVDDGDVDELLRAEGFLQDQPLHTHTHTYTGQ